MSDLNDFLSSKDWKEGRQVLMLVKGNLYDPDFERNGNRYVAIEAPDGCFELVNHSSIFAIAQTDVLSDYVYVEFKWENPNA